MKVLIVLALTVAAVAGDARDAEAPIVKQVIEISHDGSYQWAYETGNGIAAQEQGALKNTGTDNEAQSAQGNAQWTAPDGTGISFSYIADENGYQPQGSHIPQIPDYILKSIEYNKAHPEQDDPKGKF